MTFLSMMSVRGKYTSGKSKRDSKCVIQIDREC